MYSFIFGVSLRGSVSSRESLQASGHILGSACGVMLSSPLAVQQGDGDGGGVRLPRWMSVTRRLVTGAIRVAWLLWVCWSGRSCSSLSPQQSEHAWMQRVLEYKCYTSVFGWSGGHDGTRRSDCQDFQLVTSLQQICSFLGLWIEKH